MRRFLSISAIAVFWSTLSIGQSAPDKPPKPRNVIGRTVFVVYNPVQGTLACDGIAVANRVCQLRGSEGDIISVTVDPALPGLFQYNVTAAQGASPDLPRQIAQTFGLTQTQTATTPAAGSTTTTPPPPATPAPDASLSNIRSFLPKVGIGASTENVDAFKKVVGDNIDLSEVKGFVKERRLSISDDTIIDALRDVMPPAPEPTVQPAFNALLEAVDATRLSMFNLSQYRDNVRSLRQRRRVLLDRLGVADDPNEVAKAVAARIKDEGFAPPAESAVAEEWRRLTLGLKDAAPEFSIVGPQLFAIGDRDLTITIEITPKSDYFGGPSQKGVVLAGLTQPWRITTTTGFVVSSLLDDSYTVKVLTDSTKSPPTTRNTALQEKQDKFRPPEAAFLLHVTPGWGGFRDRFSGSFGLGITTGAAGRAYLGLTYRLGAAAAITAGAVGGKVKRLGNEVDPNDLGSVVPNDKLRDVYRTGWMVGLSWRIAQ